MDLNWLVTGLTALVILVATVIHGIAGFGFAQVSMGLLPFFRDPGSASVIFAMLAVVSNARVFWSVRQEFSWRDWLIPVAGLAVGLPLGILVFQNLDKTALRIFIAFTLLTAVIIIALFRQSETMQNWLKEKAYQPGWKSGVSAGFLAGVLGGAVAIPGPPMLLYGAFFLAAGLWERGHMKATFTVFFGTLMLYRVAAIAVAGELNLKLAAEAGISLPGLFLGAWIGIKIYDSVPPRIFQWLVLAMLTANAIVLLTTALAG